MFIKRVVASMSNTVLTYSFLDMERIKYKGQTKKINEFIQENQLLNERLWKTFVEQFSYGKWRRLPLMSGKLV